MELLLGLILIVLLVLCGGLGYLLWVTLKPKKEVPIPKPENAFKEFKKLMGDNDPNAERRMEQIQMCIYYNPETDGEIKWTN